MSNSSASSSLKTKESNRPRNQILASLPEADYERLRPHLKLLSPELGQSLYHVGDEIDRVYFVDSGMISLVLTSNEGVEVEVGLIGPEGVAGAGAAVSNNPSMTEIMTQYAGDLISLPAHILREEFENSRAVRAAVIKSVQALAVQSAQCALCNRLHTVEERLSRWILMVHDRVQQDNMGLTQEFMANMLGSRRSTVTLAAGALKQAGFIDYSRGKVIILDRQGLESTACECYAVIRDQSKLALV